MFVMSVGIWCEVASSIAAATECSAELRAEGRRQAEEDAEAEDIEEEEEGQAATDSWKMEGTKGVRVG